MRSLICSKQLTSLYVRVYPDGIEKASPAVSMQIPRSCFQNTGNNVFFITLDANIKISNCLSTANWKPLQRCRQYKIGNPLDKMEKFSIRLESVYYFRFTRYSFKYEFRFHLLTNCSYRRHDALVLAANWFEKTQSIANEPTESSNTNIKSMNYLANELGETKLKFDDLF